MPLSIEKCIFGQEKVEYLGYSVDSQGIKPLQRKLQALHDFHNPTSQKDLLHLLGAINYYRPSLRGLVIEGQFKNTAQILQPLYSVGTTKLCRVTSSSAHVYKHIFHVGKSLPELFRSL